MTFDEFCDTAGFDSHPGTRSAMRAMWRLAQANMRERCALLASERADGWDREGDGKSKHYYAMSKSALEIAGAINKLPLE